MAAAKKAQTDVESLVATLASRQSEVPKGQKQLTGPEPRYPRTIPPVFTGTFFSVDE